MAAARRWAGPTETLAIGLSACLLFSCTSDTSAERIATTSAALNTSPTIRNFVLYAERSVKLGSYDLASGGDVGVAAVTVPSFGDQLVVGDHAQVTATNSLLAPSVTLGSKAQVGDVQTNTLHNDGAISVGTLASYPSMAMPHVPAAGGNGSSGADMTIGSHTSATLVPGNYGALSIADHCNVTLSPGTYSFASVSVSDHAQVAAGPGAVTVFISGTLGIGEWDQVAPANGATADQLTILVAGMDGPSGSPAAATVGIHSQLTALVAVPHGTLAVADHTQLTGAFSGFDIALSDHTQVTFQTGFSSTTGGTGSQILHDQIPPIVTTAPLVSSLPATTQLSLAIGLPLQVSGVPNSGYPPLDTLIDEISAPNSTVPALTTAQFAAGYGPSASDYTSLQNFATANGLSIVQKFDSRNLLVVTGPAATIEQTFAVNLNVYQRSDGTQFFAPANDPSVNLNVPILYVSGLTDVSRPILSGGTSPHACFQSPIGSQNGYAGPDVRNAYLSKCTSKALEGQGQTVALVASGGIYPSDVLQFANGSGPAGNGTALDSPGLPTNLSNIQQRMLVAGSPPSGWVGFGATTFDPSVSSADESEQVLDIDMVLSVAPQANILLYQDSPVGIFGLGSNLQVGPAILLKAIADESDVPKAQIISSSISWTPDESDKNVAPVFMQFAVQRQSYFTASGDWGALLPNSPYDPSVAGPSTPTAVAGLAYVPIISTPLVTVVGGTELVTSGNGGSLGSYIRETTWNDVGQDGKGRGFSDKLPLNSASTGGFVLGADGLGPTVPFPTLPIPNYQLGVQTANAETNINPLQARMIPDVAWLAAGVTIFVNNGTVGCSEGTSDAAPMWAGFAALVNQLQSNTGHLALGPANPALYANASTFNDINDGSNNDWFDDGRGFKDGNATEVASLTGIMGAAAVGEDESTLGLYHALNGYDMATGLGTPTCSLLQALAKCSGGVCDGQCVDIDTDPNNCGACGQTCGGLNCVGGQCEGLSIAITQQPICDPITGCGAEICVVGTGFIPGDNIHVSAFGSGNPMNTLPLGTARDGVVDSQGEFAYFDIVYYPATCLQSEDQGTITVGVSDISGAGNPPTYPTISAPEFYYCAPPLQSSPQNYGGGTGPTQCNAPDGTSGFFFGD